MNLGIFIGRLNPPHIGHIGTIKKALEENSKVLVLLGKSENINGNNPLSFLERKKILENKFKKNNNLKILEIKDNKSDLEWVKNILNLIEEKYCLDNLIIKFYGGNFKEDSAILVLKQYEKLFNNYKIDFILNSRKNSIIKDNGEKYNISSTNFREALYNKNYNLAKKFSDKEIFGNIKEIISNGLK